MNIGAEAVNSNMDYNEVSGSNRAIKKSSSQQVNPKEIKQRCEQIFSLLKGHPSVYLFLEPLDPNHPKFNEISKDFINLQMIELNFKQGYY